MSTNMNFFYEWIKVHVDQEHENHESFFQDDEFFSCKVTRNYGK